MAQPSPEFDLPGDPTTGGLFTGTARYTVGGTEMPVPEGVYVAAFDNDDNIVGRAVVDNNNSISMTLTSEFEAGESFSVWLAEDDGSGGWIFYPIDNPLTYGPKANAGAFIQLSSTPVNTVGPMAFSAFLPVELTQFTARANNDLVTLDWQTASEASSDFFEVQRSSDNRDFESIGELSAAGESVELLDYQFTDREPLKGTSYYRLRQVDYDGSEYFSKVVSVVLETPVVVSVFPNPTVGMLQVQFEEETGTDAQITLSDARGKILRNVVIGNTYNHELNLETYPSGMYFLRITNKNRVQTIPVQKR